jgi:hypothetical protein
MGVMTVSTACFLLRVVMLMLKFVYLHEGQHTSACSVHVRVAYMCTDIACTHAMHTYYRLSF